MPYRKHLLSMGVQQLAERVFLCWQLVGLRWCLYFAIAWKKPCIREFMSWKVQFWTHSLVWALQCRLQVFGQLPCMTAEVVGSHLAWWPSIHIQPSLFLPEDQLFWPGPLRELEKFGGRASAAPGQPAPHPLEGAGSSSPLSLEQGLIGACFPGPLYGWSALQKLCSG